MTLRADTKGDTLGSVRAVFPRSFPSPAAGSFDPFCHPTWQEKPNGTQGHKIFARHQRSTPSEAPSPTTARVVRWLRHAKCHGRAQGANRLPEALHESTLGLMPFGAEKDDNGNWKFTDVKPKTYRPLMRSSRPCWNGHQRCAQPLSQVALKEPLPEKFHEPGRLAPAARLRVSKHIADYLKYEQEREDEREIGVKKVPQIRTRLKPFLERFGSRQIGTPHPGRPGDIQEGFGVLPDQHPQTALRGEHHVRRSYPTFS